MKETLDSIPQKKKNRRRALIPIWIKVFVWIFLVFGCIAPLMLIYGLLGNHAELSLYGLTTYNPISTIGLLIISLFALKGAVSFGLWFEKNWAVNLAIGDALLGLVIFTFLYFQPLSTSQITSIPLEPFFLTPYLVKMILIRNKWKNVNS